MLELSKAPEMAVTQLDTTGRKILRLVQRAAGVAEENSRHELEMAEKFSDQLRAAEDRFAESRQRSLSTRKEPPEPNNGFTEFTQKSWSDSCGTTAAAAERSRSTLRLKQTENVRGDKSPRGQRAAVGGVSRGVGEP